jgi:hypothetical protein
MKQFNLDYNQVTSLCVWMNDNTKIAASIIYDGVEQSLHVELHENKKTLYAHLIEGLKVKAESIINLDMSRLIGFLLNIKSEQEELAKNSVNENVI